MGGVAGSTAPQSALAVHEGHRQPTWCSVSIWAGADSWVAVMPACRAFSRKWPARF